MEGVRKLKISPVTKDRLASEGAALSNLKITEADLKGFPEMPKSRAEKLKAIASALVSSIMWYWDENKFDRSSSDGGVSVFKSSVGGLYIDYDNDIENEVWKLPITWDEQNDAMRILELNGYVIGVKPMDGFCCLMPIITNIFNNGFTYANKTLKTTIYEYEDLAKRVKKYEQESVLGIYVREDYVPDKYKKYANVTKISSDGHFIYPTEDLHGRDIYYARLRWDKKNGVWGIISNSYDDNPIMTVDIMDFTQRTKHTAI